MAQSDTGTREPGIRLRQLEMLWAVIECGSMKGGAAQLGISVPVVSRGLAQLEQTLGYSLFLREGGKLVPTPEAERLTPSLARMFSAQSELRRLAFGPGSGKRPRLVLAVTPGLEAFSAGWLTRIAASEALSEWLPSLEVLEVSQHDLAIREGRVAMAVSLEAPPEPQGGKRAKTAAARARELKASLRQRAREETTLIEGDDDEAKPTAKAAMPELGDDTPELPFDVEDDAHNAEGTASRSGTSDEAQAEAPPALKLPLMLLWPSCWPLLDKPLTLARLNERPFVDLPETSSQGRLIRGLLKRERVTPASLLEVATPASAGRLARAGSAATIIDALSALQVLEDARGDLIGLPLSMRSERYLELKWQLPTAEEGESLHAVQALLISLLEEEVAASLARLPLADEEG
ncbi:LysR family transcriptional regulator [Cobetia amphilecti]|uniref:LysR family transcriptional regulator n=1 Tax=Cobetia amphilecti TaxID=1055104 RepID=UPI001CDA66EE|nr:LysR family transcriptional regulator [Cobetia amphilecti]UBU47817.1 LysR family transcriptional regulator [Cobetia amphilecti]